MSSVDKISHVNCRKAHVRSPRLVESAVCLVWNTTVYHGSSAGNPHQPVAKVVHTVHRDEDHQMLAMAVVRNTEVNCLLEEATFRCTDLHGSCQAAVPIGNAAVTPVVVREMAKLLEPAVTLCHKGHRGKHQGVVGTGSDWIVVVAVCRKMEA